MPETRSIQNSFTSGEVSPRLFGRTDLKKYSSGLQTQENFLTQKHGGLIRRSATRYVADAKDASTLVRLISFQFSTIQTYILEFGDLYIRFYRDKAQMIDPTPGTAPTEVTTTYTSAQLREIKFTQSADVLYLVHPNHPPRTLSRTAGNDLESSTWTLAELVVSGPFGDLNLDETQLLASTGTLTVGGAVTITATGSGHAPFTSATVDVGRQIRLDSAAAGVQYGRMEITGFTSATEVNGTVLDAFVDATPSSKWKFGEWSDTIGPWTVTFHQERLWFGGNDDFPQTLWGSGVGDFANLLRHEFNDITLLDDFGVRFVISSAQVNPIRWLLSDNAGLQILTSGREWIGRSAGGEFDPITPTNFSVSRQSTYGADDEATPYQVGPATLFITADSRSLREFVHRFDEDRFVSPNLAILSEHITVGGILDTAIQQEPDQILWLVRNDGQLLSMTYEREENVIAWARHILGGTLAGAAQPSVESVAVIRDGVDDLVWMVVERTVNGSTVRFVEFIETAFDVDSLAEDAFYGDAGLSFPSAADTKATTAITQANPVVVTSVAHGFSNTNNVRLRDILGTTELNDRTFTLANVTTNTFELSGEDGSSQTAYVSGGTAILEITTVTGLSHLQADSVAILVDGAAHPNKTVDSSGEIVLDNAGSVIHVGLGMTSKMVTMPITASSPIDTRGNLMRINRLKIHFNRSTGGEFGVGTSLSEFIYRKPSDPMDAPPPLVSDIKVVSLAMSTEELATVTIQTSGMQPMNILSIVMDAVSDEV